MSWKWVGACACSYRLHSQEERLEMPAVRPLRCSELAHNKQSTHFLTPSCVISKGTAGRATVLVLSRSLPHMRNERMRHR